MGNIARVVAIVVHAATNQTLAGHIHYRLVADCLHSAIRDIAGVSPTRGCILVLGEQLACSRPGVSYVDADDVLPVFLAKASSCNVERTLVHARVLGVLLVVYPVVEQSDIRRCSLRCWSNHSCLPRLIMGDVWTGDVGRTSIPARHSRALRGLSTAYEDKVNGSSLNGDYDPCIRERSASSKIIHLN